MRCLAILVLALVLTTVRAQGQDTNVLSADSASAQIESDEERKWEFSASTYGYLVPDDRDFVQPTVTADRGWFHFEARYNYENLDTGSAWLGYNFSGGKTFPWEFTSNVVSSQASRGRNWTWRATS